MYRTSSLCILVGTPGQIRSWLVDCTAAVLSLTFHYLSLTFHCLSTARRLSRATCGFVCVQSFDQDSWAGLTAAIGHCLNQSALSPNGCAEPLRRVSLPRHSIASQHERGGAGEGALCFVKGPRNVRVAECLRVFAAEVSG